MSLILKEPTERMASPTADRHLAPSRAAHSNDDSQSTDEQSPPFTSISVSSRDVLNELSFFGMSNMITSIRGGGGGSPQRRDVSEYGDDDSVSIMSPGAGGRYIRSAEPTPDRLRDFNNNNGSALSLSSLQATFEAESRPKKEKRVSFVQQQTTEEGSVNDLNSVSHNSVVSVENIFDSSLRDLVEDDLDSSPAIERTLSNEEEVVRSLFHLPGTPAQLAASMSVGASSGKPTDNASAHSRKIKWTRVSSMEPESEETPVAGRLKGIAMALSVTIIIFALTVCCFSTHANTSDMSVNDVNKNRFPFTEWMHIKPAQARSEKLDKKPKVRQHPKEPSTSWGVSERNGASEGAQVPKRRSPSLKKVKAPIQAFVASSTKPLQSAWSKTVSQPMSTAQRSHKKGANSYKSQLIVANNATTSDRLSVPVPETPPLERIINAMPAFLASLPGKLLSTLSNLVAKICLILLQEIQKAGAAVGQWARKHIRKPIKRTAQRTLLSTGETLQSWASRLDEEQIVLEQQ